MSEAVKYFLNIINRLRGTGLAFRVEVYKEIVLFLVVEGENKVGGFFNGKLYDLFLYRLRGIPIDFDEKYDCIYEAMLEGFKEPDGPLGNRIVTGAYWRPLRCSDFSSIEDLPSILLEDLKDKNLLAKEIYEYFI